MAPPGKDGKDGEDGEEDSEQWHARHEDPVIAIVQSVAPATLPEAELIESTTEILHTQDVPLDALDQLESTKNPRRVKVYEMMGDSWSDRGTGFCMGLIKDGEATFLVKSEDSKDSVLLESKIIKEDLYQIQQNTLIVWQELDGTDVALSFQEEEGCLEVWNFLRHVQKLLNGQPWDGPEDGRSSKRGDEDISDDEAGPVLNEPVFLPDPSLSRLCEVEELVHLAMVTISQRESLAKFVLSEDYIPKLISTLETAEDMESILDLHRLCNIVKALILLNDAAIFECILKDDIFLGVAGILEYDPDFPNHKAEHRKFLSDGSKFKEVVEVKDPEIRNKIHQTFRLQYLKDVVLARILDDPTFSILNTLIFFNQVDIVSHFQHDEEFLDSLFALFDTSENVDIQRKSDAVLFIQQFTGIGKTLQAPARAALHKTFVEHGLFQVLVFALGLDAPVNVRLSGVDIVMAVIDHDPKVIRSFVLDQHARNQSTLCETLIQLLLSQKDIGTKSQVTEAMRLLLDPTAGPPGEGSNQGQIRRKEDPEMEKFFEMFYAKHAPSMVQPLLEKDFSQSTRLSFEEISLFTHLCDLLCFCIRAHTFRSKFFILSQNLSMAISRIFLTQEKHLHLAALRYFRVCIGMSDEFYNRHLIKNQLFGPLIALVAQNSHRNNLLNSASLELFDAMRRDNMKALICHVVENYREPMLAANVDVFDKLVTKYEQLQETPPVTAGKTDESEAWQTQKNKEAEEDYFDREEPTKIVTPEKHRLVDDDYDDENTDPRDVGSRPEIRRDGERLETRADYDSSPDVDRVAISVDEKIGEKRRRASLESDDDEKLSRLAKSQTTPDKKKSGSPGNTVNSFKKKMMFTFGKKDKDKENATKKDDT